MNHIFPSLLVGIHYAVILLTPASVRGAARVIGTMGLRIENLLRNVREVAPQTALVLGVAMFASAPGFGQNATAIILNQGRNQGRNQGGNQGQSAITGALPPDVIVLRREGNEALYNMDYATARAKFEEIKKKMPNHPAGDLYVATVIWLEHLNKSRRLQTSLYKNESSFYAGAEKAKEESEGDAVDSTVDRAFRDRMAQAKTKALSLVARNKNDADAQYFLGAYYGVMAGYEASTARKFYSAMRNGSRS
ncbi:MAG: hypothetical protein J2P21_24705, partial [Chloracidobacterium sp.]|nr:hypothetical protein [Chloracidobacterium sp.]